MICCSRLRTSESLLVVERDFAMAKDLKLLMFDLYWGSGQLAAFDYMKDPVEVEEAVAQGWYRYWGYLYRYAREEGPSSLARLPRIRWYAREFLASRPKLIGGARAEHI